MYKGALQYSKLTVFLFRLLLFFFLQNDVEAPAYLRTPGYAPVHRTCICDTFNVMCVLLVVFFFCLLLLLGFFFDMYRMRMRILAIYLWMDDGNYYMFI